MSSVVPGMATGEWDHHHLLFEQSMLPLWSSNLIFNESVLMVSKEGERPHAAFLFEPDQILSVRNSYLNKEYHEGIDWIYENGQLKLTEYSQAAHITEEQLYFTAPLEGATYPAFDGRHMLWNRKNEARLIDKHLAVTYRHSGSWQGPRPQSSEYQLLGVKRKLFNGEAVKLILYGDSISEGAESSGRHHIPPYMPTWGELLVKYLQGRYLSEIEFINAACGGQTSQWGAENVEALVSEKLPDLVILAFGMNDGSQRMSAEQFEHNVRKMIDNVKAFNPKAEFIVISTMLPNPELVIAVEGTHRSFQPVLNKLVSAEVALADLTGITSTLLQRKKFIDMTSNNVNHPNDYLIRWYAQVIAALLS